MTIKPKFFIADADKREHLRMRANVLVLTLRGLTDSVRKHVALAHTPLAVLGPRNPTSPSPLAHPCLYGDTLFGQFAALSLKALAVALIALPMLAIPPMPLPLASRLGMPF